MVQLTVIGLAIFSIFCFVRVWQKVTSDMIARQNQKMRKELKEIQEKNALLIADVESLKNPVRINKIAEQQLGMVSVEKLNVYLEQGK